VPYYSAICKCGWFAEPVETDYPELACEQRMAAAAGAHDPAADTQALPSHLTTRRRPLIQSAHPHDRAVVARCPQQIRAYLRGIADAYLIYPVSRA
jgi:hypothetical protein